MNRLVGDTNNKKVDVLLEEGKDIKGQMVATVAPLLSSIEDASEAIFLTAHKVWFYFDRFFFAL